MSSESDQLYFNIIPPPPPESQSKENLVQTVCLVIIARDKQYHYQSHILLQGPRTLQKPRTL